VNGETLANLALLARFGVRWFGELGVPEEPGTSLVTVTGSVPAPTVLEVAVGTPLRAVLAEVGAVPEGEALIGGLAGSWVDLSRAADVSYSAAGLRLIGARRGVGSMMVLPPGGCVLMETARIACYLAEQSAGQCGPCMFGLPTIAADCESLAHGDAAALGRLRRRLPVINGRGACSHPDGTVGLVGSALNALERAPEHLALHLRNGDCGAPPSVVPLPAASAPSLTAVAAPEDDGTQARSAAGRRFRSTPGLVMSQATAGSR
jgi:NADH:ubiquinone oxidoreductase subunit F (NADH-binding)